MTIVSIQEAKDKLPELIRDLAPGDEVVITRDNLAVARLVSAAEAPGRRLRRPGTLKGTVLYMAPDFDSPLDEFKTCAHSDRLSCADLRFIERNI